MNIARSLSPANRSIGPSASPERETIAARLREYEQADATTQRNRLVEEWRKHHPEAAKEVSNWLKPLIEHRTPKEYPSDPDENWHNDVYYVTLRRHKKDPVFGTEGGMIQLGIASLDGSARHDWRDFQAIKNQLAGPECEAFELYPAESRLLDPSNYYTLWCFPGVKRLKIGQNERRVWDADDAMAPQRRFPAAPDTAENPKDPDAGKRLSDEGPRS